MENGGEISLADLHLDPISRKVWCGERNIHLSDKEYALLEYFMRNPKKVLGHRMIYEYVWNQEFNGLTNAVNVYIYHLRRKLSMLRAKGLIHTVPGKGWMLQVE